MRKQLILPMMVLASAACVTTASAQVTETGYFLYNDQGNFDNLFTTMQTARLVDPAGLVRFITYGFAKYRTAPLVRPMVGNHISKGFFGPWVSLATGPLGGRIDYVSVDGEYMDWAQDSVPAHRPFGTYNRHAVSLFEVNDSNGNMTFDAGEALSPVYINMVNPMFGPSARRTSSGNAYTYIGRPSSARRWALAPNKVYVLMATYTTYLTRTSRSSDENYYQIFSPNGFNLMYHAR